MFKIQKKRIIIFLFIFSTLLNAENYLDVVDQINLKVKKNKNDFKKLSKEELELIKSNLDLNKIKKTYYLKILNELKNKKNNLNLNQNNNNNNNKENNKEYLMKKDILDKKIKKIKLNIILKNSARVFSLNNIKYYYFDLNLIKKNINKLKAEELYKKKLKALYSSLNTFSIETLNIKILNSKVSLKINKNNFIKEKILNKNKIIIENFSVFINKNNDIIIKRK